MSGAGATGSSGFIITSSALMLMSSSKVLPPVSAAPALPPALEFKSSGAGTCAQRNRFEPVINYATMQLCNSNQPHQPCNYLTMQPCNYVTLNNLIDYPPHPTPSLILLLTCGPDEQQGERQPWWERQRVQGSHSSPRRPGGRLFRGVCIAPQAAAPSVLLYFATVCVCAGKSFLLCVQLACSAAATTMT